MSQKNVISDRGADSYHREKQQTENDVDQNAVDGFFRPSRDSEEHAYYKTDEETRDEEQNKKDAVSILKRARPEKRSEKSDAEEARPFVRK